MTNRPTRMSLEPEPGNSRLVRERQFHDAQAFERYSSPQFQETLHRTDEWYLGHASWIASGIESLGNVEGKLVLDWGCGHGMASALLARRGARVVATDLSGGYCRETSMRASVHGRDVGVIQADGERLPFSDSVFDAIWGHAILHHLETDKALGEVERILKPDGKFVFCDPFEGSLVIHWARWLAGWVKGHRTEDEQPMNWSSISKVIARFPRAVATFWDIPGVSKGRIPGVLPGRASVFHAFSRYVMVTNNMRL